MKYLCMFVAFKIKTNKSEKGEIRKNLTTMKTGKTELPRSTSGAGSADRGRRVCHPGIQLLRL